MTTLAYYDVVIFNQTEQLSSITRRLNFFLDKHFLYKLVTYFSERSIVNYVSTTVNKFLFEKGLVIRGILESLKEQQTKLVGQDFNELILTSNDAISEAIKFKSALEKSLKYIDLTKFPALQDTMQLHEELIENMYELLRIFKKANKKIKIPTSELAKGTAKQSTRTITTLLNGH